MLASAGYAEAALFAGQVEELSRTVEYLQVLAAGAVDRTRTRAITDAAAARACQSRYPSPAGRSQVTGRNADGVKVLNETDANWPGPATAPERPVITSPADDGCRNTAEFLRLRLRIPVREARRRLVLAAQVLPRTTITGEPLPPEHEHLATALTPTAATADPDFLTRVARRWADTIDADGTEPTEETLRHTQGLFIRKPRHGLHHLEIFATTAQYEYLATAMNTTTNPRTSSTHTDTGSTSHTGPGASPTPDTEPELDRRSRPQRQLDGILSAVQAGLTTNQLPTTGGNRPHIIATINYCDLFPTTPEPAGSTGTGTFAYSGPVPATTLRKIACDADIIPALLGTHGEILDLGRKTRLFTTAQRLALTARDQGCAFPNCTAPAPWCEAHHITYWSHQGPTSTDNGVLLCNHHHPPQHPNLHPPTPHRPHPKIPTKPLLQTRTPSTRKYRSRQGPAGQRKQRAAIEVCWH
ncbi:HNH endonuclease signature motif containing protein [Pseudarthrobacter sp. NamE2]|uniref:HNH endonuclease signature motif containing protein n=1 Tax=Pseudarthrobacter sp. NamE2 TaxID=2576838 RepID=UPI001F0CE558|nr:HNH endonuclease signature motif containing protein [Pseudarthrobacter sp. NamE2]